jgi:1,4-alpha-glucan branching enzyme
MRGSLAIVLHAHLPFVRFPDEDVFLEENWLYEAISETYLPLLESLERLAEEQVPYRLTLSLSPTLVSMLTDRLLISRYSRRLDALCELTDREVHRTSKDANAVAVAQFYQDLFHRLRQRFHDRYRGDLVAAFRSLQESGHLDVITTSATHGFLPLLRSVPEAVRAQLTLAANQYRQLFGRDPHGIWLPECGYYEGLENLLANEGFRFFFVDTRAITNARPQPLYDVYAPLFTGAGVAAFGRDPQSAQQVWSPSGYPGDPVYRDFYRDLGWDAEYDYIHPYLWSGGERTNTGIKYHRITGATDHKDLYSPALALRRAREHAEDFVQSRARQFADLQARMSRPAIVTALYDAELFGHWWFEGPTFLEFVLRGSARPDSPYQLGTHSDFLRHNPENQLAELSMSSWGEGGYAGVWLDPSNDWIYRHLHQCSEAMVGLAREYLDPDPLQRRALNQASRELLLAQASDWAFIMRARTAVDYAVSRTKEHIQNCLKLQEQVRKNQIDQAFLSLIEGRNNIFPELDYRVYGAIPAKRSSA